MKNFNFLKLKKINVECFTKKIVIDKRGYFSKFYCSKHLKKKLNRIKQVNISYNKKAGVIRGMHYQKGMYNETKIISCLKGKIYDVIIDLRKNSKNYLKYYGIILSEKNRKSLIVPKGYAHGFQVLEDNTYLIYFHSEIFKKSSEKSINPLDPLIGIKWKQKINKIISSKDKKSKYLSEKDVTRGFKI